MHCPLVANRNTRWSIVPQIFPKVDQKKGSHCSFYLICHVFKIGSPKVTIHLGYFQISPNLVILVEGVKERERERDNSVWCATADRLSFVVKERSLFCRESRLKILAFENVLKPSRDSNEIRFKGNFEKTQQTQKSWRQTSGEWQRRRRRQLQRQRVRGVRWCNWCSQTWKMRLWGLE